MEDISAFRKAQRADGPATIMSIATANPQNCIDQLTYPDFYFRVTNSDHMTVLKEKFQRMCDKSRIKNRYLHITESLLKENPDLCDYKAASLNARQDILVVEIPKLGKEVAAKAITRWGQPKSKITHLVFCSTAGVDAPGADFRLIEHLGLNPSVKRYMMYQQGCFGGGTVLRVAKDLAENNRNARVLVVCCEITVSTFHGPSDARHDNLVGQALFGDGAGAVIVGADPIEGVEKGLFEVISAGQTIIPNSDGVIKLHFREEGVQFYLCKTVCDHISKNIRTILNNTFSPLTVKDWNSLFWIVHPGGPVIFDQIEDKLQLRTEKLEVSRKVLREYGNMASASVIFILEKMWMKSVQQGMLTTGEGLEWGALLAFGPGVTVETVLLRSLII